MAPSKRGKTLADKFAELEEPQAIDFDPEAIERHDDDDDDDDDQSGTDSDEEHDGREHYVSVGKSKLRKQGGVELGPEYAGSRISRDALGHQDHGLEGPEETWSDESAEAGPQNDPDAGHASESSSSEDEGINDDMDEGAEDDEEDDEEFSDGDDLDARPNVDGLKRSDDMDTNNIRALMSAGTKSVTKTLTSAANAEAEKGEAIQKQRKTFDALLNSRIRLQKALISTNRPDTSIKGDGEGRDAIAAAETAALTLLNSITSLRMELHSMRTGNKRSHAAAFTTETPARQMRDVIEPHAKASASYRDAIIDKWSKRTRDPLVSTGPRLLNKDPEQQTLMHVIRSQLSDPERLVSRTQMPRSCAPGQTVPGPHIYDDADFYGLLLKELLEQRSADVAANVALPAGEGLSAEYKAARDAKTKKVVDTRASKGRKLRYTVHEKLQNFMAPEDRGAWGERQAEELFSSLLGKRMQLAEDEAASEDEEDGMDVDLGGFNLFGGVAVQV